MAVPSLSKNQHLTSLLFWVFQKCQMHGVMSVCAQLSYLINPGGTWLRTRINPSFPSRQLESLITWFLSYVSHVSSLVPGWSYTCLQVSTPGTGMPICYSFSRWSLPCRCLCDSPSFLLALAPDTWQGWCFLMLTLVFSGLPLPHASFITFSQRTRASFLHHTRIGGASQSL